MDIRGHGDRDTDFATQAAGPAAFMAYARGLSRDKAEFHGGHEGRAEPIRQSYIGVVHK